MTTAASLWELEAARYDAVYDSVTGRGRVARARLAATVEIVGEGPGRVLDVGMGAGRLCAALEPRGWDVYGVDSSEAMVALARKRLPRVAARLLRARAEGLPFADEAFDAVTALGSLEYTEDAAAAVRELARVLRPGGTAVVSWPNFRGLVTAWRRLVLYPAVRVVKRGLPVGRMPPAPSTEFLGREAFLQLLADARLGPERLVYIGPRGALRDDLFGPALGAQLLVTAHKERV